MQKIKVKPKELPSLSQTLKRVTNYPSQTTANLLPKASPRVFETLVSTQLNTITSSTKVSTINLFNTLSGIKTIEC